MPDVARMVEAARRWRPSPRVQRWLLVAASIGFVVGAWWSFRSLGVELDSVRWGLVATAGLLGVPLTVVANTGEYLVSVRLVGGRTTFPAALRVTVMATAANLLPIPGALVVRTQGLRELGSRTRQAVSATAVVGLVWIGVSAVLAGAVLVTGSDDPVLGGAGLAAGATLVAVSIVLIGRWTDSRREQAGLSAAAVAVELFAVTGNAIRLVLVLVGLGIDTTLTQAFVLAVSSSLSSATGILPGGFGIREAIAAGLSPLVGLPPSAGFAGTAVNRIVGMVAMVPLSLLLAARADSTTDPRAPTGADDVDGASP